VRKQQAALCSIMALMPILVELISGQLYLINLRYSLQIEVVRSAYSRVSICATASHVQESNRIVFVLSRTCRHLQLTAAARSGGLSAQ